MVLPKSEKLKIRAIFRRSNRLELIARNKFFKLVGQSWQTSGNLNRFPQVGLVLGRKKVKLAHERNRIKRRLEEAYRLHKTELWFVHKYKYLIFFPEAICLKVNFEELVENLRST